MSIGILGAGEQGAAVAHLLARTGEPIVVANRRGPASLAALAHELGPTVKAGTAAEAAAADIVVLATRWVDLAPALQALPPWNGRIVVDATNAVDFLAPDSPERSDPDNPFAAYGIRAIDLGGRQSSQVVRELTPGARLIKAFNHIRADLVASAGGGRRVLFYSGDDADAKEEFHDLLTRAGAFPVDLGRLDGGGELASLPLGPLSAAAFVQP